MGASTQRSEAEAAQAGSELLQSVEEIFEPRLKAAWLSGSFAYQGAHPARSDVDVVVVLDELVPLPADTETMRLIRKFVDAYLEIHARHGFDPDLDFPGEYVTPAMLDEAIRWRALAYDGRVATRFPTVMSDDYWLGRPDRWYNAWISMAAFSRFAVGDRDYHRAVKLAAWKTIARFLLLRSNRRLVTPDEMLLGLDQFGVKPRYPDFWPVERDWVDRALDELQAEGVVALDRDLVEPNMDRLGEWEREVEAAIAVNAGPPPLLLDIGLHRQIEDYAADRWAALAGERV